MELADTNVRLFSRIEAAYFLGITPYKFTLYARPVLPVFNIGGRELFAETDLREYLDSVRVSP